jgi:ribonuclease P protein component
MRYSGEAMKNSLQTADFARVRKTGRKRGNGAMLVTYAPAPEGRTGRRLGIIVTNKQGTAVQVNRLKRVLRAAFQQEAERFPVDCDVVLLARSELLTLDADGGMQAVAASLRSLAPRKRP